MVLLYIYTVKYP